jgi:hypothetical protein
MRKPGITKIQLPKSMIKVGPSNSNDADWVCLVVKNVFPSAGNALIAKVGCQGSNALREVESDSPSAAFKRS